MRVFIKDNGFVLISHTMNEATIAKTIANLRHLTPSAVIVSDVLILIKYSIEVIELRLA